MSQNIYDEDFEEVKSNLDDLNEKVDKLLSHFNLGEEEEENYEEESSEELNSSGNERSSEEPDL